MSALAQPSAVRGGAQCLALGTVQFGMPYGVSNTSGKVPLETARMMVQFAISSGIDTVDTAIGYGDSEQVLGATGMGELKIVSKLLPLPAPVTNVRAWVLSEAEKSLERLGVEQLHGLLLHRSSDLFGSTGVELYAAMRDLQEAGKVRKIGVSIYAPTELDAHYGTYSFDLVQAPLNLVDQRLVSSGWLERLKEQGCEVHVRSAFLQGLLLMQRDTIPRKFTPWSALWDRWHTWLKNSDVDAVSACLSYPLSFPEIDRVVVGALNLAQLRKIIKAAEQGTVASFLGLACEDEKLVNPANWKTL